MQENDVRIVKQLITGSKIFISEKLAKKFEIGMECRANIKPSKREDDKSILLNLELNISTKDEELKIELVSDIIFELEKFPDDYTEIAEQKLIPIAKENLLNSLDDMLVIMGYQKMELAKKM